MHLHSHTQTKAITILLSLCLSLALSDPTQSQIDVRNLKFERFSEEQGLSSRFTTCMLRTVSVSAARAPVFMAAVINTAAVNEMIVRIESISLQERG